MGNTQPKSTESSGNVWLKGFSLDDFRIPSKKTEIAEVTMAVTAAAFEIGLGETPVQMEGAAAGLEQSPVAVQLSEWDAEVENQTDLADRKAEWPLIDPDDYSPAMAAETRIEDNLKAIRLLRDLKVNQREVTDEDRVALLKYCGWGGLSRIFSPDGSTRHAWADYRDELASLSTEEEFAQMRSSITSAFYSDQAVVSALWAIVQKLGFKGGRILEPSAGVGHVLAGMPRELARKSDVTAVELDPVSAGMLEANFAPLGVQVHCAALEKTRLPVAFYDLVIGNVPFGDYKTLDTSKAPYADWSIHNYFLGKSVDLVRPGGLVVLITSRHSLDSEKEGHRKWLSAHAELLAAYRLPTMAFKEQANTEAVTDILVFKRRETLDYREAGWAKLADAKTEMLKPGTPTTAYCSKTYRHIPVNRKINAYYVGHPDNVIGLLTMESGRFGPVLNPVYDGSPEDLNRVLMERIEKLPSVYVERAAQDEQVQQSPMKRYGLENFVSPGAMVLRDGRICVSEGDELLDIDSLYTGTARKRVIGMIEIKKQALRVIEHQARSSDDTELTELQKELNRTYDHFVAGFGFLSTNANSRLMRSDPDWPVMLALEIWDEEEEKATKADIFFKRTVGHREVPAKVESVKDGMLVSLAQYGRIVLADVAKRTGMPVMQVVKELRAQALAFRDPQLARWVPADEYLSGHIREKIAAAKAAGPAYECNIPALEAVLPKDLGPSDVEARLGAPWIPVDVIAQFAQELVEDKNNTVSVGYDAGTATWSVKANSWRLESVGNHSLQRGKWGTPKRCALELVEAALNQQPPTVTYTVDGKSVVDRMATLAAREKWQCIKDQFRKWVYQDGARRDRLLRIYNDAFNQIVNRKFDGSHLVLPGMSEAVTPYQHQLDAIWRILVNGNTLLAHCVGAGKTLVMCAASMELRRLGKAAKPLHVVQNSTLEQYTAEFVRLYPQARVLMASKEDLHGEKRRTFVARIACGDWDAVVMTQATFERIMLAPDLQQDFIDNMIGEAWVAYNLANDHGARRSLKEIEKRMKDYQARLERAVEAKKDADCVWFNELGVDYCFIDEAHAYKRLPRTSKMPRMAGLPTGSSMRAFDVFMKTRYIMGLHGGREEGVVMATATFITNTLAEVHTFQVYMQPNTLRKFGLYEFDAWSASYGESVTGIELSPDGGGYRINTRYAKFVNLPELMAILRGVADIRTRSMLKLPTPEIMGGKPQTIVAAPSEELLAEVAELVNRADKIRNRVVRPDEDNMLKITNDGRKAALDIRLLNPNLPRDPNGKLSLAADNIARIWRDGHAMKTTQLVFSDLGTPSGDGFNVYDEMRTLLIERGLPAEEIEFVHDHNTDKAKAKLFKRVRQGLVRVLLGSTPLMGTGTNVQMRLKAIHQLDAPWLPSDVEQRDGRGVRQGNLNGTIELWRYVTERSFDAYSWNLLNVKANFIEQVMTAEAGLRSVEDISMSSLTYAEIKAIASGNPLVMEKAQVDADVQKFSLLRSQWEDERWYHSRRESDLVTRMAWIDQNMAAVEKDAAIANGALAQELVFEPLTEIAKAAVNVTDTTGIGFAAAFRAHSNRASQIGTNGVMFGRFGGFEAEMFKYGGETTLYLRAPTSKYEVRVDRPSMNDLDGVAAAAVKALKLVAAMPKDLREEYGRRADELATTRRLMAVEFDHADKLDQLLQRQREIEAELDLDKDDAGTTEMAEQAA